MAVLLAAVAGGLSGCGDDGDGPAASRDLVATGWQRHDPAVAGGDRAQVAEVIRDVEEGLVDDRPESVCRELTEALRDRIERTRGRDSCKVVAAALRRSHAAGVAPVLSEIRSVRILGDDRAVVVVRDPDGTEQRVAVVRDGTWALPDLDLGVPPGLVALGR